MFHKYLGESVAVANCMSHFSFFVTTKATVKLDDVNTGHAQGIGVIIYCFPNRYIIYPVVLFYYYPGRPSNTITSGALKFYVGFQNIKSEPHFDFVYPQGRSWILPY